MPLNPASLKWRVLLGCFLSYMFDAVDIIILAIAMPAITASLQISQAQAGLLVTATLLGIGLSSVVMGRLADTMGRRTAMLLSLITFGVLTMAIAAATDWRQVLLLRFLAGLGLGGVWSAAAAHVSETWPAHQRGRATAFVLSSFSVGAVVAALAAAWLLPVHGWRLLFLVCGAAVIVAIVYIWLCVPESAAWRQQRDLGVFAKKGAAGANLSQLFAPGMLRITLLGTTTSALALSAYWGASTWLPTFLVRERGLDVAAMASFVAVLNVGMFVGYNAFGLLADRIGKQPALIASLVGSGLMLPVYTVVTDHATLLVLGPVFAFFMAFAGLVGSYFAELYPTHIRATGAGFCFNVGRGISAFAPLVLGITAKAFGFAPGIALCGGLFLLSAAVVALLPGAVAAQEAGAEASAAGAESSLDAS
ncbi:MFS transporter [Cupriavidus numazuensis]|uniref:Metabolite transport protein YjhB n=1 Tax=Cupriavidus numazuensis TaxID=221992 RepID=A0ABM8TG88_9BURK|nr:MFS transporter [Cupriavidus numazuensis]CAG2144312.1 Putative metabolite transport protein YjhB [Cupriavidus numazuensis]